jgi:hypothetical protein
MHYTVDLSNRIIDVGDDWDASLELGGGTASAMRAKVVGRPLEDFMAGDATKMFVRAALEATRLRGETRVLPYRCDCPSERRRFDMVISPLGQGLVRVEHRLVFAQARPPTRSTRPVARARGGWRCSQCLAVRLTSSGEWVEDDDSVKLAQDVCPACASQLFESPPAVAEQPRG